MLQEHKLVTALLVGSKTQQAPAVLQRVVLLESLAVLDHRRERFEQKNCFIGMNLLHFIAEPNFRMLELSKSFRRGPTDSCRVLFHGQASDSKPR